VQNNKKKIKSKMLLFLYGIQQTSRDIDVFCVDEESKSVHLRIVDYEPYVLLLPEDMDDFDESILLESLGEKVTGIELVTKTPLIGFTNHRKDTLIQVNFIDNLAYYAGIRQIKKSIEDGETIGIKIRCILHEKIPLHLQLLHITGLQLQSWVEVDDRVKLTRRSSDQYVSHAKRFYRCNKNQIQPAPFRPIPHLNVLCVQIFARSNNSTQSNIYAPDANEELDEIKAIGIKMLHKPDTHIITHKSERQILYQFNNIIVHNDVHILVHSSDGQVGDCLLYITRRCKRLGTVCNLSMGRTPPQEHWFDNRMYELSHPGREAIDVVDILKKFMVSPPLDGYTLLDALYHQKIVKDKEKHLILQNMDYIPINTMSPWSKVLTDLSLFLCLMSDIIRDNNFICNNMMLSKSCDLSLSHIVLKGQQKRVFNCFVRKYHDEDIYINHEQLNNNFVVVQKPRCESSFPDPEWLETGVIKHTQKTLSNYMGGKDTVQKTNKRFAGGFVITPVSGFYVEPQDAVCTLDFASLYPSIIEGEKICYMRVVYDRLLLTDTRATLQYIPLDDHTCAVFVLKYDGCPVSSITDKIIAEITQNRKNVRQQMKTVTDPFLHQSLDAQQLTCKVLQNGAYGFLGSDTSGLSCMALAAAICVIGQYYNKTVRYTALKKFGCRCVGGDTDSVFLQFPTDPSLDHKSIIADVYKRAHEFEEYATQLFPSPNRLEFESMKLPCLLTSRKKTYACIEYGSDPNKTGKIVVKGMVIKKRDRCIFVQMIGSRMLESLLKKCTNTMIVDQFISDLKNFNRSPKTTEDLYPYVITTALGSTYKCDTIALRIAKQMSEENGTPTIGTRLRFVVYANDSKKLVDKVCTPQVFLTQGRELDIDYYLNKQLRLAIKQLLSLDCHHLLFQKIDLENTQFLTRLHQKRNGQMSLLHFMQKK
jgi:DNA polymerase elongation subunit (family B)